MKRSRAISRADRTRIDRALQKHKPHDFEALRTRALVMLAMGSALRVSELVALDVSQVEEHRGIRVAPYLRNEQAKGGRGGPFIIPPGARAALRAYLAEGRARGYISDGPLFVAHKRNQYAAATHGADDGRPRLTKRGAQHSWDRVQRAAGISPLYKFHDLRHDSITRFADASNGNAPKIAQFARLADVRTAMIYVHTSVDSLAQLGEVAERAAKPRSGPTSRPARPQRRGHARHAAQPKAVRVRSGFETRRASCFGGRFGRDRFGVDGVGRSLDGVARRDRGRRRFQQLRR
jgi:integrase